MATDKMDKLPPAKVIDAEILDIEEKKSDTLNDLIETEFEAPLRVLRESNQDVRDRRTKDWKFYEYTKELLPEWWDEFNTSLDQQGNQKYKTVFQFAREKGKNKREQELIYEMIGPEPDKKSLRVPWLGDWKKRRMTGFGTPTLPSQVKDVAKLVKKEIESKEAIRSTAPVLIQEILLFSKLQEEVKNAFSGQMFRPDKAPEDRENLGRAKAYIALLVRLTNMKLDLHKRYMEIFGVNPDEPETMVQVNQVINQTVNQLGQQPIESLSVKDIETLKLARMMRAHAENFGLPLPQPKPEHAKTIDGEIANTANKQKGKVQ